MKGRRTSPSVVAASSRSGAGARRSAQAALRELVRVGGLFRRLSEPHFARFGVSGAQWGVLRSLARLQEAGRPEPRMHELGEALLVQPPSLSATLDRMERAGLVVRREDRDDQRTRRVRLTEAGRELVARALPDHVEWMERVMGGLNGEERAELNALLCKLCAHMKAIDGPGAPARAAGRPRRVS